MAVPQDQNRFDIVIVGAGISGVNAAYRVQTQLPDASYTILESRGDVGGTWDLFRYPGIRSDSDLHCFGFQWRPYEGVKTIADGESIQKYIQESAALHGIDSKIQFHHKVVAAEWSSKRQEWHLTIDMKGKEKHLHTRFLYLSVGYYDYSEALPNSIPGLQEFKGLTIQPQFWPQDVDYSDKKVVIIGSGATAITLFPTLVEKASHVTMLQRNPGYILSQPSSDPLQDWLSRKVPSWPYWLTHRIVRYKILILSFLFVRFCQTFPNAARKLLRKGTIKQLPSTIPFEPDFAPWYNPWEQRLCIAPDGDFYKALKTGKSNIVTGTVNIVNEHSIEVTSPDNKNISIETDIIVMATGLKVQMDGGILLTVDGAQVKIADRFLWKGDMVQDIPNLSIVIGYPNLSWTLGADATALHICRILKYMKSNGFTSATPRLHQPTKLKAVPVLDIKSTYIQRAKKDMPKCGDHGPWKPRSSYFKDLWEARWGNINNGMEYTR